jgi:hypothetical protein
MNVLNQEIRTSYGSMLPVDLKNRSKPEFSTTKDNISSFSKNREATAQNGIILHDLHTANSINLHGINAPLITCTTDRMASHTTEAQKHRAYLHRLISEHAFPTA